MLKKYQYIFIVIFLGGMIFATTQYLPLLEEEVHSSKTLAKKTDNSTPEQDGADDDSGDDENDNDEFFDDTCASHFNLIFSNTHYKLHKDKYQSLVFSITTPPPKI